MTLQLEIPVTVHSHLRNLLAIGDSGLLSQFLDIPPDKAADAIDCYQALVLQFLEIDGKDVDSEQLPIIFDNERKQVETLVTRLLREAQRHD